MSRAYYFQTLNGLMRADHSFGFIALSCLLGRIMSAPLPPHNRPQQPSILSRAISGSLGSALYLTTFNPLEVVKVSGPDCWFRFSCRRVRDSLIIVAFIGATMCGTVSLSHAFLHLELGATASVISHFFLQECHCQGLPSRPKCYIPAKRPRTTQSGFPVLAVPWWRNISQSFSISED